MQETWKTIKGYEGLYEVSNLGRAKSLPRMHGNVYWNKEIVLKENIAYNGYSGVFLQKNNKSIRKSLHRLVAEAFIDNPDNKPQVNHIDGNKLNNCVNNLEWCTGSENQQHSRKNGLQISISGEKHWSSKRIKQYDLEGNFIKEYPSIVIASKETKNSISSISNCLRGIYKQSNGYVWRYANAS